MGQKMLYTRNERRSYRGISASGSLARTPPASNGEIPYPLLDLEGRKALSAVLEGTRITLSGSPLQHSTALAVGPPYLHLYPEGRKCLSATPGGSRDLEVPRMLPRLRP